MNQFSPVDESRLPEPREWEKQQVKRWRARIEDAVRDSEPIRKRIKENRLYLSGRQGEDGSGKLVRCNLIYVQTRRDILATYARNPEIAVDLWDQVSPAGYEKERYFAKTMEAVLNRQVNDAGLKSVAKRILSASKTAYFGAMKAFYQRRQDDDPMSNTRQDDTQDDINRAKGLVQGLAQPGAASGEREAALADIEQQIEVINSGAEVKRERGWVFAKVRTENLILPFSRLADFSDYTDSPWIAEEFLYTRQEIREKFGFCPEVSVTYGAGEVRISGENSSPEAKAENERIKVYEIWDKPAHRVCVIAHGCDRYLRAPYIPDACGKRFYPYFLLNLMPLDEEFWGLCTVELLRELQDEFNSVRTKYRELRESIKPGLIYRKGAYSDEELRLIANHKIGEMVAVEGEPGIPVGANFAPIPASEVNPALNDTSALREDWERISATGDAAAGFIAKAKTATEAAILREGGEERSSGETDEIDDLIEELAQYMAEINLQVMSAGEVASIAGPPLAIDESTGEIIPGSVWPTLSLDESFNRLKVRIRAGSSGKPNKAQGQENWVRFSAQFIEFGRAIMDAMKTGQVELAESMIKIMAEGLRRFDEKIDPREFLPKMDVAKQEPSQEQMVQMQQQMQAMQLETEKKKAEIEKIKSEAQKNLAEVEAQRFLPEAPQREITEEEALSYA